MPRFEEFVKKEKPATQELIRATEVADASVALYDTSKMVKFETVSNSM